MSAQKRVMIVEDDRYILESIHELLEGEGYSVISAVNGQDALEKLRLDSRLPDLVLLDLMMPVLDGFGFREQQLRDERLKGIPVIVMSADGHVAEKRQKVQAVGYLKKPLDLDEVLTAVGKACS